MVALLASSLGKRIELPRLPRRLDASATKARSSALAGLVTFRAGDDRRAARHARACQRC
jgi:hypothetical protein